MVKIYLYCAYVDRAIADPDQSIDMYMLAIADRKRMENEPYVRALIDCAVDRLVHYPKGVA